MQARTQFSIFLINKSGQLAEVMDSLARANVNFIALTLTDSLEQGVLRIVCDNPVAARAVLKKADDQWTETEVLMIGLKNKPGSFAAAVDRLSEAHVNISYAYCTGGAGNGQTNAILKVSDMKKAQKVLS